MIYIIISLFSLFFSYLAFKKITNMRLTKLNFISCIFYRDILLYIFLGSILVILNQDRHYIISRIADKQIRIEGYYYLLLFSLSFPSLMRIILKIVNLDLKKLNRSYEIKQIKTVVSKNDDEIYWGCCFFLILAIFSGIYVFYKIGCIPILEIFSRTNLIKLRIDISRNFQGNIYIKNLVFLLLPPIFTFITYIYWKKFKFQKWKILFYFFFCLTILSKTHNLEKAPFFFFLINFYLLRIILFKKLRKREIYFLFLIVILGIMLIYKTKGQIILSYNTGPIGRIIFGQIEGMYASLRVFPELHQFLGFNSLETAGRVMMEIINPAGVERGTAGVMNSFFMAEAYAHFSKLGIYLSLLYVPFIIVIFCKIISLLRRTPITLAIYSYIGFSYLTQNLTGGIIAYIYSPILIVILGYVILLYIIGNLLKRN